MPSETHGDLIREQADRITSLNERVDHVRREFDRIEQHVQRIEMSSSEVRRQLHDIDKALAVVVRDVEKLDKKVDELLSRRWDLWKLFLAAFLGGLVTLATGFVARQLERLVTASPRASVR